MFVGLYVATYCKSAQYGFHDWLLDAMEGMTPVSALLHSATLVTAGVLLTARFSVVIAYVSYWMWLVVVLIMVTLCTATYIASLHTDTKRLVAYSTIVHIGFAALVSWAAPSDGALHLVSHG